MSEQEIFDEFNSRKNSDERVDILMELCRKFRDENKDMDEAFKYAAIASIATNTPRADVCCLLGSLYWSCGQSEWAKKWFNNAINNAGGCFSGYFTWFPLICLANIYNEEGNEDISKKYLSAAELINPNYLSDLSSIWI